MREWLDVYSLRGLCSALQVRKSGYYAWRRRPQRSSLLNNRVSQCFAKHGARAGAPCLTRDVNALGLPVSQRTVGRALARLGLRPRSVRKFKATTNSKHKMPVDANVLDRQFTLEKPNQVWVSDITYIRTDEGWLYLAIMLDLFSRQIVGWQMSSRIDTPLVKDALQAALVNRGNPTGVMIHSDQGSQYCAKTFRQMVKDNKLMQSMSRKGNCWDNAVAESFFASLKKQSIYGTRLATREQARQVVFEYIEHYYNRVRGHSSNGWLTPVEFERLHHQTLEESCVH
jgi:transposase InsO family protein